MSKSNADLMAEFSRVAAKAINGHGPSVKRLPDLAEALIASMRREPDELPAATTHCDLESCGKMFLPSKRGQRFCSASHRAQWARENAGIVPARIQSINVTAEGARVIVVRVLPADAHRIDGWVPSASIDLLEAL